MDRRLIEQALLEAAARRAIALAPGDRLDLASGVCVRFGGKLWIVTASHAIREWGIENLFYIPRPPAPLVLSTKADIPSRTGGRNVSGRSNLRVIRHFESGHEIDLAVLGVEDLEGETEFHALEADHKSPVPGEQVLLFGLVGETARTFTHIPTGFTSWAVFPFADWPLVVEGADSRIQSYSPDIHYLMPFPQDSPNDYVTEPGGLSGGGIWRLLLERRPGHAWDPRGITLGGIQVSWFRESRLLKATRVEQLVQLLASTK